jgi:multiple RNA-binding domain-containing protein 1
LQKANEAISNDPKLQEFLQVMRPRGSGKARTWANDDELGLLADSVEDRGKQKKQVNGRHSDVVMGKDLIVTAGEEDDEEYQDLSKIANSEQGSSVGDQQKIIAAPDPIANDKTVSDLDYFRSRMKSNLDDDLDETGEPPLDSSRFKGEENVEENDNNNAMELTSGDAVSDIILISSVTTC